MSIILGAVRVIQFYQGEKSGRCLAAWLLPALIEMTCFALWGELPFFAGAKRRNPKNAPLEAKPLESFSLESKNDCWLLLGMRAKSAAITFYMLMNEVCHQADYLLQKNKSGFASRNGFFDVNQRKLPAIQRGTHDINEEPEVLCHKAARQNINLPVTQQDSAQAHSAFSNAQRKTRQIALAGF